MKPRVSREALSLLPWIAAAIVWLGFVSPMRAEEENRLSQQSRIRRDRVKAERSVRETQAARARVASVLGNACRTSGDPAALRQRAVAATTGLPLAPFSLTVTGGPEGGAIIDASGPRGAVLELLRRLGDPSRGGYLRGASLREKDSGFVLSATTGAFDAAPGAIIAAPACSGVSDPPPPADEAPREPAPARKPAPARPAATPSAPAALPSPMPAIEPPPPFTLVAFLSADGKSRVSIRVRDEIRVVSVGDSVDGWKCLSIDRDEGAVFSSPFHGNVVLKSGANEGGR